MDKKKIPILSIVLYVFTGLLLIYTVWSAIHSYQYIANMIAQGQLVVGGNEYDIVSFYMANCAQYLVFAAILFTLGWMMQKNSYRKSVFTVTEKEAVPSGEITDDNSEKDNPEEKI
jgi:predicted ferric reductase